MIKCAEMWLEDPLPALRETLTYARAKIPHYQGPDYAHALHDLSDLQRLPFVRPETYAAAPERFAVPGVLPDLITFSSSTTGAIGRPRWHLQRELDTWGEAVRALLPAREGAGVTLVIHPYDQGGSQRPAGERLALYAPFLVPWHYELILRLLRDGWRTAAGLLRIDHIDGFSPALRIFTTWLGQQHVDPGSLGVTGLTGYGSIQPHAWRRRLTRSWGASYQDIYGLSEVKHSEALSCPVCGAYHLLRPIVPEVVDPDSGAAITRGFGVLVLSELRPFTELQVLLRYWTDDIVEIAAPCMISDLGFHFRGRRGDSLALAQPDGPAVWVGALQVAELVAELPDVAQVVYPWAAFAHDVGAPRFALRRDEHRARVTLELRYSAELYPERAAELRAELRARLLQTITGLAALVEAGLYDLSVETCEPGALTGAAKV